MDPELRERAIGILSACPFIQKLVANDENLLERLAGVANFTSAEAGDVVFRQGDPGQNCYIILDGQVGIYQYKPRESKGIPTPRKRYNLDTYTTLAEDRKQRASETDCDLLDHSESVHHYRWITHEGFSTFSENSTLGEELVVLGVGNLFGELALMNNAPRSCSVKAVEDCEMLWIGKEQFQSVHQDLLQASEAQVIHDFCEVLRERCGSVMRAWRTVLDPRALGELFFSEFVDALTSLSWQGNTSALWGALVRRAHANNRDAIVSLQEVSPEDDRIVERFKFWVEDKFGGAIAMFNALTGNLSNGSLSYESMCSACSSYAHLDQLDLIWGEFLDVERIGSVSIRDMAFLEINGLKRKAALEPGFVMALEAAKAKASNLRQRGLLQKRTQEKALREFMRKLRAACSGSFIRGFRRILDRNNNMTISKVELLKGCRQVAFSGDTMALWKSMDADGDGTVQLLELHVKFALVLASFKRWCSEKHGGCLNAMQYFAAFKKRKTAKWNLDDFVTAVCKSSYPGVHGIPAKQAAAMVHEAADVTGTRSIIAQDIAFLDSWEPTPWLCAEPDLAGKEQLINALRSKYSNSIVAWRRLFDKNNKNHVSYKDFCYACQTLQLKNAPGIWRALDTDFLGYISLRNIDNNSASVLLDFKEWAEDTFGSIQFAFRVLDSTNSNSVSLPIFKRVLSDFGFPGDTRVLFQSLKPDASGRQGRDARLRLDDIKYLSSWEARADSNIDDDASQSEDQSVESKGKSRRDVFDSLPGSKDTSKTLDGSETATDLRPASSTKPRAYTTTSEYFTFCRSNAEYDIFNEVRLNRSKLVTKSYSLADIWKDVDDGIEVERPASAFESLKFERRSSAFDRPVTASSRPSSPLDRPGSPYERPVSPLKRPVSPYERPVSPYKVRGLGGVLSIPHIGAHLTKPGSAGKRHRRTSFDLGKSASLPALVGSARSAGSQGSNTKDDKHLPSLVKKSAEEQEEAEDNEEEDKAREA